MSTLHFTADEHEAGDHPRDLDSAFNDDYRSPFDSTGNTVKRWLVIAWSVAAWCAGSFVMAKGIIEAAPAALYHLNHWLG